jgi:enediyne biosynthesis protein E4
MSIDKQNAIHWLPVILVLALTPLFFACGDDDDDDNDDGSGGGSDVFCENIVACDFGGDLGIGSMDQCEAYWAGLSEATQQCVLGAADCDQLAVCLGLGSDDDLDDDANDDVDDDADDDTAVECVDETTFPDGDIPDVEDQPDLYAQYCPDNPAPTAFSPVVFEYFEGEKEYGFEDRAGGDIEGVLIQPEHPMHVKYMDLFLYGGCGEVIVRIFPDLVRSAPDKNGDLIDPIRVQLPDDAGWVRVNLPETYFLRNPADRFWVGIEHIESSPYLGQDRHGNVDGTSRFYSREWAQDNAPFKYGTALRNFMVRVTGNYYCEKTGVSFTDVTEESGIGLGVNRQRTVWTDLDNDGWDDIVLNTGGYDLDGFTVYHNGGGAFVDITDATGLNGYRAMFGLFVDMDNDGDQDAYLGVSTPEAVENQEDDGSTVLTNNGDMTFSEVPANGVDISFEVQSGSDDPYTTRPTTATATAADIDGDGYVDIYVGNWWIYYPMGPAFPDHLFKGAGDGTFVDIIDTAMLRNDEPHSPRPCYGAAVTDYNNDGLIDVYVANYGGQYNRMWKNAGDGSFENVAAEIGLDSPWGNSPGISFSADFGDIDNDGDMDAYIANITHPRYLPGTEPSTLCVSSGAPDYVFTDVTEAYNIAFDEGEIEVSFIDFDNNGLLDFFVSDLYSGHYGRLFEQQDDGTFQDVTYWSGIDMHDCTNHSWGDYDKDGDLDLLVTRRSPNTVHLWRNDIGQNNNWATFRLEGTGDLVNRNACGARVTLVSGDLTQIREVQCGRGHANSQPSIAVEFGLGQRTTIDSVTVAWPGGGTEVWDTPPINTFALLTEGEETAGTY